MPWSQRVRFGLHVARSRYRSQWRSLDQVPAKPWLIKCIGEQAYQVIWHPLLKVKFGDYHDQISAAWIWHRIWRVASSRRNMLEREMFGCLESGTATLVDPLVEWLRARPNVELQTGVRVQPIEVHDGRVTEVRAGDACIPCDAVISTVALPVLDRLVPHQSDPYFERVREVKYIGIVCMLLSLRRPFSRNFWTNINDPRISFNGIIEQSTLNQNLQRAGLNVVYVPFYLPTTEPRYRAADQDLFAEYTAMLTLMNPEFSESWVKDVPCLSRAACPACLHDQLRGSHARSPDSDPGSLRHGLHSVLPGGPHYQPGDPPGSYRGGHGDRRFRCPPLMTVS